MNKNYYVYVLASKKNGTLYIGVTSNLRSRVLLHREGKGSQFTSKYKVDRLVYFETYNDIGDALTREKELKKWERKWKLDLIESQNSLWQDLFDLLHYYIACSGWVGVDNPHSIRLVGAVIEMTGSRILYCIQFRDDNARYYHSSAYIFILGLILSPLA